MTIFDSETVLKVYDGAGKTGTELAELHLTSSESKNDKLAFDPTSTSGGTTYYFNLGDILGVKQGNPCTLFALNTGHHWSLDAPRWSIGTDTIGNDIGKKIFGKETYTFWIKFDRSYFYVGHYGVTFWEAQIVCAFQ